MHIVRFEAQNIQRLQAVTIEPTADSPAVVLAGGNEEGTANLAVEAAVAALRAAEGQLTLAERELEAADVVGKAQETSFAAAAAVPDRAALREKVKRVQFQNAQVEANRRKAALADELKQHQDKAAAHTKAIETLDAEKTQRLAEAKFPIEGLGLNDAGVTWKELPFEQASTAIRTRVSVAIGFALHPKLKVLLVRNGNDLDGKNLQLLADAAKEQGGQLWIERIAGGDGLQTVVIEDGAVKTASGAVVAPGAQGSEAAAPHSGAPALPLEEGAAK